MCAILCPSPSTPTHPLPPPAVLLLPATCYLLPLPPAILLLPATFYLQPLPPPADLLLPATCYCASVVSSPTHLRPSARLPPAPQFPAWRRAIVTQTIAIIPALVVAATQTSPTQ